MEHMKPLKCPNENSTSLFAGSKTKNECVCKKGYTLSVTANSSTCIPCPENHYKDEVSNNSCTPCDEFCSTMGVTGATRKEECLCAPGYYFNGSCVICTFPDKYCLGGQMKVIQGKEIVYIPQPPSKCPQHSRIIPGVDLASQLSDCKCDKGFRLSYESGKKSIKKDVMKMFIDIAKHADKTTGSLLNTKSRENEEKGKNGHHIKNAYNPIIHNQIGKTMNMLQMRNAYRKRDFRKYGEKGKHFQKTRNQQTHKQAEPMGIYIQKELENYEMNKDQIYPDTFMSFIQYVLNEENLLHFVSYISEEDNLKRFTNYIVENKHFPFFIKYVADEINIDKHYDKEKAKPLSRFSKLKSGLNKNDQRQYKASGSFINIDTCYNLKEHMYTFLELRMNNAQVQYHKCLKKKKNRELYGQLRKNYMSFLSQMEDRRKEMDQQMQKEKEEATNADNPVSSENLNYVNHPHMNNRKKKKRKHWINQNPAMGSPEYQGLQEKQTPQLPSSGVVQPAINTSESIDKEKKDKTESKKCERCEAGTFKSSVGDDYWCTHCGTNFTSFPGSQLQIQCFCIEGFYYVSGTCLPCPEGAKCLGGFKPEAKENLQNNLAFYDISYKDHLEPFQIDGYFLDKLKPNLKKESDWKFIKCPTKQACLEKSLCAETMSGFLCGECKSKYTNNFTKKKMCTACPGIVTNIIFHIFLYIILLAISIIMAYINVASGVNNKTVHSILIRIFINYIACMLILNVIQIEDLNLPNWLSEGTTLYSNFLTNNRGTVFFSMDCIIKYYFNLSYADSFFYTMVVHAMLPVILPVVATIGMYIIFRVVQWKKKPMIETKLALLKEAQYQNEIYLYEELIYKYQNERILLLFRYLPLPGTYKLNKLKMFLEDMTPIYVTILFFTYTRTTSQVLKLLDCSYIEYTNNYRKYYLTYAPSVQCNFGTDHLKFFVFGCVMLILWGLGIPFFSFFVIFKNRHKLHEENVRFKYGFLTSGYKSSYWYWESLVYIRKIFVLLITSIIISPSNYISGSRIWLSTTVAVTFLISQFLYQPFDERDYFTLNTLENHSMFVWTFTLLTILGILRTSFNGTINLIIISFLILINLLFIIEIIWCLTLAYIDHVRNKKNLFEIKFIGKFFRVLARFSDTRKMKEPYIIINSNNDICLVAKGRKKKMFFSSNKTSATSTADNVKDANGATDEVIINVINDISKNELSKSEHFSKKEKIYFLFLMTECVSFALNHLQFSVLPTNFFNFVIRFCIILQNIEKELNKRQEEIELISEGNMEQLINWAAKERVRRLKKKHAIKEIQSFHSYIDPQKNMKKMFKKDDYKYMIGAMEKDIRNKNNSEKKTLSPTKNDVHTTEKDINKKRNDTNTPNDGEDIMEDFVDEENMKGDKFYYELNYINENLTYSMLLFDEEKIAKGISLSDFNLALIKMQVLDPDVVMEYYIHYAYATHLAKHEKQNSVNRKIEKIDFMTKTLHNKKIVEGTPGYEFIKRHNVDLSLDDFKSRKERLQQLKITIEQLQNELAKLKEKSGNLEKMSLMQEQETPSETDSEDEFLRHMNDMGFEISNKEKQEEQKDENEKKQKSEQIHETRVQK